VPWWHQALAVAAALPEVQEVAAEDAVGVVYRYRNESVNLAFVKVPAPAFHDDVTLTDENGAISSVSNNTCTSATDEDGQCEVTFVSDTTGTVTGHAEVTVEIDGVSIFRETDGTGRNSSDAVKTYVDARIAIEPDATNEVGEPHTFTVTVEEDAGDGGFVGADGESVTVSFTSTNGADSFTDQTCSTDSSGQCSVTITSDNAGEVEASATSNVDVAGLTLTRTTDGTDDNSDAAVKTYVDAFITIEPDDTNGIGEEHTFTVTVMEHAGGSNGFVAASGEMVTVTLTDDDAMSNVLQDTCSSTDTNGQCEVTFVSDTAGTVTGHAESHVQVGGLSIFRQTDGEGDNSDDAVKTYIDGSITWFKVDGSGAALGGATFEACRTVDRFGTDIADECVTVTDNMSPDQDSTEGTFLLAELQLGTWTVQETAAPTDYTGDLDRIETVSLTLSNPDAVISEPWVNERLGEGCTPGFWQGGNGSQLWNVSNDSDWTPSGENPFYHETDFNDVFDPDATFDAEMFDLVSTGGGESNERKAMRSLVAAYLNAQIEAGAQAVQLFDSWVGCLGPRDYERYVAPHSARVFRALDRRVPAIHFGTGNPHLYPAMKRAGGDVIGLDWRIELGAGMHRDLSGRENIYLNAGILGLSRAQVDQELDRIVDFSGLEKFIDTPVKRYSSGMYVRLGFSVAAHVEPDVLLVDEVLAVGDAQFRQKCAERIGELREAGTTIVFVAHNLYLVRSVCDTVAFVEGGRIQEQGDAVTAISAYESWLQAQQASVRGGHRFAVDGRLELPSSVDIHQVTIENGRGEKVDTVASRDSVTVRVEFEADQPIANPNVILRIVRADGVTCSMARTAELGYELGELRGRGSVCVQYDPRQLISGAYSVEAGIAGELGGVPLSVGHSPWVTVAGETLACQESSGVFVPSVVWARVEQSGQPGKRRVGKDEQEAGV
jgi:energy-coupling factor transporter ATP-binding protein EcfA2